MKTLTLLFILFLLYSASASAQQNVYEQISELKLINEGSHNPTIKKFPQKSFYESKVDWQHIIDSTWGPGLPLEQKQLIFNTFISTLEQSFDGFESLGLTQATWDTLKTYYYNKIDSTTSRGRFSAIMNYLSISLRDWHTYAFDNAVFNTPLNPGVPLLHITSWGDWKHSGAVVTVLQDSIIMVLRVANNHPLNLQPGDIILGYNGVKWIDLLNELLEVELPIFPVSGGSQTAHNDAMFVGSIMNWHLFDTIDILKYSTGDTLHLDLTPMIGFNTSAMTNNEQMPIPGVEFPPVPFPNFNTEPISYGIIQNTNIGYIYIFHHFSTQMNQKMFEAVDALKNTDGLIIDMRYTYGGYINNIWQEAFEILSNEVIYTLMGAVRCSPNNWSLCFNGDSSQYRIVGNPPSKYERPIALLLGPFCMSMGDRNAYRLSYLYNVRTFGKSTFASMGLNNAITSFPGWSINYSLQDFVRLSDQTYFLNRKEFPIDFPVWHNRDDVALGKDAVVEKALEWINNLVYPRNTITDRLTYSPGEDSCHLSTIVENPNSHQLSARAYLKTLEGVLIDSINLVKQTLNPDGENWTASLNLPSTEEFYKIALTVFDETASDNFSVPNATRFTTVGPVVLDSIFSTTMPTNYSIKPFVKNQSAVTTITSPSIRLICNDPWVTSITPDLRYMPSIPPGAIVSPALPFTVTVDTSIFPDYFNFKVEVISDGWAYWTDSMRVPPIAVISINPTELNFGEVAMDSSATKTFTITNYGDEDLVISNITSSEPVFTVNITSTVILPDSSQDVEVTFTPSGLLSFNGKIEITHNAAGSPDSVMVAGEGVIVPGVEEELQPLIFSLEQNYPNPFNPTTVIKYSIPEVSKVMLKLYNLLGEEVSTLVNEEKVAGYYTVEFNAANLPSGVYFYQLIAGDFVQTKKMILMK